jgi:glutamate-1-semialdehyde 2,1-aminomutase
LAGEAATARLSAAGPAEDATARDSVAAPAAAANDASAAWLRRARACIPGGVNSPVRAFRAVGGEPLVVRRAAGAEIEDVDGNRYLDFVCSWGPLILGHAHPEVVAAVREAAGRGTSYGALCPQEVELAERVTAAYPGLEQVRFVSSGTEATMSAIRLSRGATGRDLIVKFAGCYHGHADHLLVAAGSGLATLGRPDSAGVPEAFAGRTRVLPLDDDGALEALFSAEGDEIAAVIIEPLPANNGLLVQRSAFLRALRELTARHGAMLIFDEVITGFRLGPGGAAEATGITPDLATFGKVIGGGLPVGAFGGPAATMRHLAPEGPVYQAGTLSGNPVAMVAGLTTLEVLERDDGWRRLEALGEQLEEKLAPVIIASPIPLQLVRRGSIFWLALQTGEPPRAAADLDPQAPARYAPLFHALLRQGIYLAPSAYEVGFLSLAHDEQHLERFAAALRVALEESSRR